MRAPLAADPPPFCLQEFQPWFKWLIFDAFFTLVLGLIVQRFEALRPLAEAVGWL
jgi:hypothetical protein